MRAPVRVLSMVVFALPFLASAAPAPPAPPPPAAAPVPAFAAPAPAPAAPSGAAVPLIAAAPASEIALLRRDEGVWNATIQMAPEPGADPEITNGLETNVMGPGGLWLISDYKGRLMGQPFQGHGILGYDVLLKKYVRVWVDSTQAVIFTAAGTYDAATSTLTMWMEARDSSGKPARWRTTMVWKDNDTRVYTMYAPGSEKTEATSMIITYKRRK